MPVDVSLILSGAYTEPFHPAFSVMNDRREVRWVLLFFYPPPHIFDGMTRCCQYCGFVHNLEIKHCRKGKNIF